MMAIFDETYRVVGVESQRLTIQGILSGEIMTIVNTAPDCPLTPEEYPLGQLIALTDPSTALLN
jgi:glutathione peroxidase-family protein